MTASKSPQHLSAAIESLVDDYIREVRRDAEAALERAFVRNQPHGKGKSTPEKALKRMSAEGIPRRSTEDLAKLRDRLYELVCAHPGAAMTVFAEALGLSVRELNRPMAKLKAEGRVRRVGERNMSRYFPSVGRRSHGSEA